MTAEPRLSLCMMVKDEETMLPSCLDSVIGCVDEIIVVDTGSTDRTVEIAQEYGATVYHHPWEDDFSKHQNQSIDYATGDWILRMDADEELAQGSCRIIRKAIRDQDADAFLVNYLSFFNRGASCLRESKIRIFRNRPNIRYEGTCHEQLKGYKCAKVIPMNTFHYGYDLGKEAFERKLERTTLLIKRQIEKEPDNYFHRLNLAVCYSTNFQFKEAIDEALFALRLINDRGIKGQNALWAYYIVSSAYLKLDNLDNAERYALEAINLSPDHLDSYFVLTVAYHSKKNWAQLFKAAHGFLRTMNLLGTSPEMFAFSSINMANEAWRVYIALGDMYLHESDMERANEEFNNSRSLSLTPRECNRMIADCYRRAGQWQQAKDHYELALQHEPDDCKSIYGLAMVYKGLGNLEKYRQAISRIKESKIDGPDIFFEKGIMSLEDKMYERAAGYFSKALELRSNFVEAYVNLALAYKYLGRLQAAVQANLNAIDLNSESTDARINLGNLYYELWELALAEEMYESVISLDPNLVDIRLRLCEIHVMDGNLENCVHECDRILERLNFSRDMTISNVTDLAGIFFLLSRVLDDRGDYPNSKLAMSVAHKLDPEIEEKLRRELACYENSIDFENAILGCTTTSQG